MGANSNERYSHNLKVSLIISMTPRVAVRFFGSSAKERQSMRDRLQDEISAIAPSTEVADNVEVSTRVSVDRQEADLLFDRLSPDYIVENDYGLGSLKSG